MKFLPIQLQALRLPDIFTLCGIAAALFSIFFSVQQEFFTAYFLLVLQFCFDALDGRIARKYEAGELGVYLDSFSDFTAIIAVVFFGWFLGIQGVLMYISGIFFVAMAAIRLSYFTIRTRKKEQNFVGAPTVFCVLTLSTVLILNFSQAWFAMTDLIWLYFFFGIAMIVDVRIPKI